jgi:chitin disaccharide deacetylase
MMPPLRCILNADDFGRSRSVNTAIIKAHTEGVLTSCSLMVSGEAFEEAAHLAREHPALGVGLHLVLVCGKSVLPPSAIPHLANVQSGLSAHPVTAGLRYFCSPTAKQELRREINAQLETFLAAKLPCSHLDSHFHMHMHPAVFDIVLEAAAGFGIKHLRLPNEELSLHRRLSRRWPPDVLTAATFTLLYRRNVKRARARGFIFAERVYGLLQTNRLDEAYLCALLQSLGGQTNEIYCHPDTATARGRVELRALLSPNVSQTVARLGLRLINHAALEAPPPGLWRGAGESRSS